MKFRYLLTLIIATALLASCANQSKKKLILGNENWVSSMSLTFLTKAVLEEKGIKVEIKNKRIENILADMDRGNIDLFMDVWYEGHSVYLYEFPNLEDYGTVYNGCEIGLAVPSYFDIDSISQLKDSAAAFNNTVFGIREDAGVMIATAAVLNHYGWSDMKIRNIESNELSKQLEASSAQQKNFVTAVWKPDWKNEQFELKWLTDTTGLFGQKDKIQKMGRPGLSEEYPEVAEIIKRIYLSEDQMATLVDRVNEIRDEKKLDVIAKEWIAANRGLVDSWLGTEGSK